MGALISTWLDFKFPQIVVRLLPHPLMNIPTLVAGTSASGTTAAPKVCQFSFSFTVAYRPGVEVGDSNDQIVKHRWTKRVGIVQSISRHTVLTGTRAFACWRRRAKLNAYQGITDLIVHSEHRHENQLFVREPVVQLHDGRLHGFILRTQPGKHSVGIIGSGQKLRVRQHRLGHRRELAAVELRRWLAVDNGNSKTAVREIRARFAVNKELRRNRAFLDDCRFRADSYRAFNRIRIPFD